MGRIVLQWLVMAGVAALLAGCQPPASNASLTQGTVVSLGQTHLILDDGKSVMFLAVDESAKERLKDLKKGDKVTLVGKKVEEDEHAMDIEEIILDNGAHISLGV